jgi:hypothetical protein
VLQVVFVKAALQEYCQRLNADFRLAGPVVNETDLDFSENGQLGKFEEHFVLKVPALILKNFLVDSVFVALSVDGPVNVLE